MHGITRSLLVLVCILALLLSSAACSADSASTDPAQGLPTPELSGPGGAFTLATAPTASGETAIIMVPKLFLITSYEDVLNRVNKSLSDQGMKIKFVLENDTYSSRGGTGSYLPKVRDELLSGNTTADAYTVDRWSAGQITETAPTMDLTTLLPATAPVYYDKHKALFDAIYDQKITGLPIGVSSVSCRTQPAFMLRSDLEEQFTPEIKSISDILSFIDTNIIAPKKLYSILADPRTLVQLWALEQGYYPLEYWGINGYLYAGIEDKDCKPVALEKIAGFYDFVSKINKLYKSGYFVRPDNTTIGWENVGLIRDLGDYYLPDAGNAYSWINGRFVAHVLYNWLPAVYTEGSYTDNELLIPQSSQKAADIIRFVDWLYSSQDNYNMVIYGKAGTDYSAAGGRLTILKNGAPAAFRNRDEIGGLFIAWPGVQFFSSSEYSILPGNTPTNFEKVFDNGKSVQRRFIMDELMMKAQRAGNLEMMNPASDMEAIIGERNRLMGNIIYGMFRPGDSTMYIKPLEGLKNDWLVSQYANLISEFKKKIE